MAFLITGLSLATVPVQGAEPTKDMRWFARMFATLEARDHKGYCEVMIGADYAVYLNRRCQSDIQNKVKKPEDCSPESITRQLKLDTDECLAMPAAEFEQKVLRGRESSKAFIEQMTAQGVDGEKLLQEERVKIETVK